MSLFVIVLLKRTSYNKETKREAKNERRENERSQCRDKKAITADSAPDPNLFLNILIFYLTNPIGSFTVAGYFFNLPHNFRTLFVHKNYEVSQKTFLTSCCVCQDYCVTK